MTNIPLTDRPIAITDIETTGAVFAEHEIIEIGLVLVDPKTFEIIDTLSVKIQPEHIENAVPAALERNGYKPENWTDATTLRDAMEQYAAKTHNAIFYAYNVSFDWGFIGEAFRKTGVHHTMDYHRIDLMSMVYLKLKDRLHSLSLNFVSEHIGIEKEAMPHSALSGAMQAYKLFRFLMEK